jgi:hypothetical protein
MLINLFSTSELFCMAICFACLIVLIVGMFAFSNMSKRVDCLEKELKGESTENAIHIGRLERRMNYVEKKVSNPEPKNA